MNDEKVVAEFDDYSLREVSFNRDVLQLASWISEDEHHAHLRPAFFLGQVEGEDGYVQPDPRPTCYALEDETGQVVFYIRLDKAARVNIQFDPTRQTLRDRARVGRGLLRGMAFLEVGLAKANVTQWIFDTRAQGLAAMAKTRLGFYESPHELVRLIPLPRLDLARSGPPAREKAVM